MSNESLKLPDPMAQYASPYLGMGNNPVSFIDPTGGSDLPGPSADKANVPWYYLTPSEVNAIRESRGMTYQAQEDAMIMELAAMGRGYRDGDGNLFTFDRRGNLQKTTEKRVVEYKTNDKNQRWIEYNYVSTTELVEKSDRAQRGGVEIKWGMVVDGAITAGGGYLAVDLGVAAVASGIGAPAGVAMIPLGSAAIGFGTAKMVAGFGGKKMNISGGLGEAFDKGFGGSGTIGQVVDIMSGGTPKSMIDAGLMLYGLYNSNLGQMMLMPSIDINKSYNNPLITPKDNTTIFLQMIKR